ncbi:MULTISPECIES: NRAMP family divalent metal transporter [Carboxydothermus]|uniref:Mn2+/Fe2+ NRAMP family transporter n=2 Tax=Carboxydothermus TaxID=129957 RepID=A0ABX2RA59_9THEO|nr:MULTISPECIES: divalent metal cation transporter [Carboxydothermus]ABB15693.1 putative membrane protein [Carboxydothermus hydrogenoformans Z-2901]NYE57819.1 Mn2+/Fe2+ NRAMP family transporter [Carboxydothermus ferrireducens DSM 11255]
MGKKDVSAGAVLGAAFLMATSAIGPGFLTQTAVFTEQLLTSFGFVILMSILLDIGAQLNIWRIITMTRKPGQELADEVLPGLGVVVTFLIVLGGFAFNIGNIAGTGLAVNVLTGLSPEWGAVISAAFAILIFLSKDLGSKIDLTAKILGGLMILLTAYVAVTTRPPVGEALYRTFVPAKVDFLAIVTLVGGTVGGYITFAGGHRLLDAGIVGEENLPEVTKSSLSGIIIAGLMRILLFLAVLGVVAKGHTLDPNNPPASAFKIAAGTLGYKLFGLVLWAAAITSVIGSAYTSMSFLKTYSKKVRENYNIAIILFVLLSLAVFVKFGKPVKLLILAGAFNGLILPITLTAMLLVLRKKELFGNYRHPVWLTIFGVVVALAVGYFGIVSFKDQFLKLLS